MKTPSVALALTLALGMGLPVAQAATPAGTSKPIAETTCQDYLAMDETIRPKYVYAAVGHGQGGQPEAVFDVVGTDKLVPEMDKFCEVNLSASAYDHVMETSEASEKTNQ